MEQQFLEDFLQLCEKYGDVEFGYTTDDDGCTIDVNGTQVIDGLFNADDIRKRIVNNF